MQEQREWCPDLKAFHSSDQHKEALALPRFRERREARLNYWRNIGSRRWRLLEDAVAIDRKYDYSVAIGGFVNISPHSRPNKISKDKQN